MKKLFSPTSFIFLALLIFANLSIVVPIVPAFGAILLALILPGWGWASFFVSPKKWLSHSVLAAAFSYAIVTLGTLLLHYLPGNIYRWQLIALLNAITLAPFLSSKVRQTNYQFNRVKLDFRLLAFIAIFLLAAFLRFSNLGYSEFQGDESQALIFGANAIQGYTDALFLRNKAPGEILLPAALWVLNGTITEALARTPFALAGIFGLLAFFVFARDSFSTKVSAYATAILAASGFMVGFSRIVQYQTIVIWMSILALWTFWQWTRNRQKRWVLLSGIFLGIGLLAHYDAILVAPAIGWLWLESTFAKQTKRNIGQSIAAASIWFASLGATAALFYAPYLLDPQLRNTGDYVSRRIGKSITNHLFEFLQFNSFYSSFYFTAIVGLLLVGFSAWAIYRAPWGKGIGAIVTAIVLLALAIAPNAFGVWAAFIFAVILLAIFVSPALSKMQRIIWVWFAVPFWGYNFIVATPLTHIYTTLPAWALLSGWMAAKIARENWWQRTINIGLVLLSTLFLWNNFVRHDVEFLNDYPAGKLSFFWTPYTDLPETGFFGFTHKVGWKALGALLANKTLIGDYTSNEKDELTQWYVRHDIRACNFDAEFVFNANGMFEHPPFALNTESYQLVGQISASEGQGIDIYQRIPTTVNLGRLNLAQLERDFDQSATPAAMAREAHWMVDTSINFGGKMKLVGYTLDNRRAYPSGRLILTLYWQAIAPMNDSYKIFTQLDATKKYAQADSIPACAHYPTPLWRVGQIVADTHALNLSPDTPVGDIPLVVGVYDPNSGTRLDVLDVAGNPAGVSVDLTTIAIKQP